MIITRIHGGLGNQLFQYAAGAALAAANNTELKLDISYFNDPKCYREFMLDKLQLKYSLASRKELGQYNLWQKNPAFRAWDSLMPAKYKRIIKDRDWPPHAAAPRTATAYLDGYFQNESYFSAIADNLRQTFRPAPEAAARIDQLAVELGPDAIALHIRRGDYLSKKHSQNFNILSNDYYRRAAELLAGKISRPRFIVFTEDRAWAEKELAIGYPFRLSPFSGLSDLEEFFLMSRCSHQIIANSTFSWWAAWLNGKADKIVIAPKNWFVSDKFTAGQQPAEWITL